MSSSTDYLAADELQRMTEAKSARKQIAWLAAHAVPFRFNGREVFVLRVVAQEWELLGQLPPQGPRMDLVRWRLSSLAIYKKHPTSCSKVPRL